MYYKTLAAIQHDLNSGTINCVQLVESYIASINKHQHLNAFLEVYEEEARQQAIITDQKINKGTAGRLAGMVISVKDVICYKNHKVSAASKMLEGFTSVYSATVIERLLLEDAIIIGRTNCDEFAMGSSNENSAFGIVRNGIDASRVPGGSSGGSAVSVQMNMCLASLGSDTGGSVRQPASFCGLVGLKPTYGRISRHGLIAYASSFDQIGIFTHTVADAALLLEILSGKDAYDSTASSEPVEWYSEKPDRTKKYSVAFFPEAVNHEKVDPPIREWMHTFFKKLQSEGHQITATSFPLIEYLVQTYYVLTTAEASSNLSRYDGIRFGYHNRDSSDVSHLYKKNRTEGFGKEVQRRILLGTFVLSSGYFDAYYKKAQKVRRMIREATDKILGQHDFIVLPTTPAPAFKIGERSKDPVQMFLADIFTVQANLTGIPAISLPLGSDPNGLPFGLQVMSARFKEKELLAFSEYLMELFEVKRQEPSNLK